MLGAELRDSEKVSKVREDGKPNHVINDLHTDMHGISLLGSVWRL